MGLLNWISTMFQPKEVRDAVKAGQKAINEARKKERAEALSKTQFREEMRRGEREILSHSGDATHYKKEADAELRALRKIPKDASKITAKDEKWFTSKVKSEAQKESELAKQLQKGFKAMKTDAFERQAVTISKFLATMSRSLKDAEKVSTRLTRQVADQQQEILRLGQMLEERASLVSRIDEVREQRLQSFKPELAREEMNLLQQLNSKDQDIVRSYQRVTALAASGSAILENAEMILQTLAPVEFDSKELVKRVKDEISYARSIVKFEGSIMSAMKAGEKAQKEEMEAISLFTERLTKEKKAA